MLEGNPANIDSRLLNELWLRFPLVERPFEELGRRLGLREDEVLSRTNDLIRKGIVRRIGYMVGEHALRNRVSTLVGMKVDPNDIERAAGIVGEHRRVTHSYLRDHEFNMWFTLSAPERTSLNSELRSIISDSRPNDWIELPAVKFYKLRAPSGALDTGGGQDSAEPPILKAVEDGIEIVPRPFDAAARRAGTEEATMIGKLKAMLSDGTLRSFGAVVHHGALGLVVNAMVAWDVGEEKVDSIGHAFAEMPMISHCYERARDPEKWKHNLFTMVHVRSEEELESFLAKGDELTSGADRVVLRTVKEFKKVGVRL
ncbi:MAG: hypothetical protein ABIE25_04540 [Thermoplasmatota archaeon]|nr:hypothetical protein [Candidatus Thermoplasmatota archaeon]MBU1914262.1 hypothetical protein [Candidatus Thermoplasmatota archaeon]